MLTWLTASTLMASLLTRLRNCSFLSSRYKQPQSLYMQSCWSVSLVYHLYLAQLDFHCSHSWAVRFICRLRAYVICVPALAVSTGSTSLPIGAGAWGIRLRVLGRHELVRLASPCDHLGADSCSGVSERSADSAEPFSCRLLPRRILARTRYRLCRTF